MRLRLYLYLSIAVYNFTACEVLTPNAPESKDVLAEPLADLSPEQLKAHLQGDEDFAHVFAPSEGLGPIFVSNSCESCHVGDGKGHPVTTLTRFGRSSDSVGFDHLQSIGGPQLQHRAITGYTPEQIPDEATGWSQFTPPAVSGLGYIEELDDSSIIKLADPNDLDNDGISGRLAYINPPEYFVPSSTHISNSQGQYIGRFGKKLGAINLLHQIVNAYREDMGITTDYQTNDLVNYQAHDFTSDPISDPEVSGAVVDLVVFYMKTLKAPTRRDEDDEDVIQGESLFTTIGCTACHTAKFTTGESTIQALNKAEFYPYSDFLLHDMGAQLNDQYTEGAAEFAEWRTAPLWGIGLSADSQGGQLFLLHDGRASTYEEAIGYHGGEASTSRDAYNALGSSDQGKIIKFLESL